MLQLLVHNENPIAAVKSRIAAAVSASAAPDLVSHSLAAASAQLSGLDAVVASVFRWLCPYIGTCPADASLASAAAESPRPPTTSLAPVAALATTTHTSSEHIAPPLQQTVINQPVIERVIEREVAVPAASESSSIAEDVLDSRLGQLEQSINRRLASMSAAASATYVPVTTFAPAQRVDNLSNTTISNPTITGGSITAASITGTISNALDSLSGTIASLTGNDLTYTRATFTEATSTTFFASSLTAPSATVGSITATSSATSTFAGGVSLLRLQTTATSTLSGLILDGSGLRFSALDCSSYANGGTLTTDSSGNVGCAADDSSGGGSTVAGSDTQVQFNNGGSFGASANFTFSSSTGRITVVSASTTNISANYASSSVAYFGNLTAQIATIGTLNGLLYGTSGSVGTIATSSLGLLTTNVAEGSNLYYTNARADARINATSSIGTLTSAPNLATIATSLTGFVKATAGALSTALVNLASDVSGTLPVANGGTGWSNLASGAVLLGNGNGAVSTTTRGNLTEAGSSILTITGGSNAVLGSGTTIQVQQASASQAGFLSSADWTTFNGKVGTARTISAGTGLSGGGDLSADRTLSLNLGNSNSWTALQSFTAGASTTRLSVFSNAYFGGTATTTIDNAGNISAGGNLTFGTDATYNIGALGANRPSNLYVASNGVFGSTVNATYFNFNSSRGYLQAQADGVFALFNNAGTDFSRLQFGGTTASFPSIKRNGAGIDVRLADDSAYANLAAANITANGALTTMGLASFSNASSTRLSIFDRLYVGDSATTTIFGSATSTFGAGIQTSYLNVTGTAASSTFANGINLSAGCFSVNGTCVGGGGGGSGTVGSGTTGQFPYYAAGGTTLTATSSIFLATSGNLGIGTTSPASILSVSAATTPVVNVNGDNGVAILRFQSAGSSLSQLALNSGNSYFDYAGTLNLRAGYGGSTVMALNSSGNVGIGTTSVAQQAKVTISANLFSNQALALDDTGGNTSGNYQYFSAGDVVIGSISRSGASAVAYNTTSDRRLKQNIATTTLGLDVLMRLPVRDFDFIRDPSHATTTGFIAQELREVFPWAVTTNGDDGVSLLTSSPWGVDYGRITPLIVKAVQDIANITDAFKQKLLAWFADSANGIGDFFASLIHANDGYFSQKLCVGDTCVTPEQFKAMVAAANQSNSQGASTGSTADTGTSTSTPPTITISGGNPAHIHIGDAYVDVGATAKDAVGHELSLKYFLSGALVSDIIVDTSAAATDTIDYVATDTWGNTATATRTVIIEAPSIAPSDPSDPDNSLAPDTTSATL
jgi:hypothetical protein